MTFTGRRPVGSIMSGTVCTLKIKPMYTVLLRKNLIRVNMSLAVHVSRMKDKNNNYFKGGRVYHEKNSMRSL